MSRELIVRPAAEADLQSAFEWYEQQRTGLGLEFLFEVDAACQTIKQRPDSFPLVLHRMRRAIVSRFPYFVFYSADASNVIVHGVFHHRRHPRNWKQRG